MLTELHIEDLGVIERLRLVFDRGLTALTGETGAGKTMLVEAIELLVGGRADSIIVRPGAEEARIEGRFVTGDDGDEQEIVLARVIPATGRSRAYVNGRLAESYTVDLGSNVLERKVAAGDQATPEGRYRIVRRLDEGESRYYKALLLDYPNEADRQRLEEHRESGAVSASARPGGLIEIHGEGGRGTNWTDGCVALANGDMDELFRRVKVDTPVTIVGGNGRDGIFSNLVLELAGTGTASAP